MHLFGTGHSRIPVEEMFPRYGSYPGFNPMVELSMTYHTEVVGSNGQRQAMFIERMEGLAEVILSNFELRPTDAMMVFSANGLTAVPIEIASEAREQRTAGRRRHVAGAVARGRVAALLGDEAARPRRRRARPLHAAGGRSDDARPGVATPVGPGSTLAAVALVNAVKVRTAELLAERGTSARFSRAPRWWARRSRGDSSTLPTKSTRGGVARVLRGAGVV